MSSSNLETRIRILRSAWKLLEAGQDSGVRMSDIAKDAGVSRQAVYLHFLTRSELLIATTRYIDEVRKIDERLEASRNASTGLQRLHAFIDAWGNYIPEVYGVVRALRAMKDIDEAAKSAWDDRMQAVRQGCDSAVRALKKDGVLSSNQSPKQATDLLWTLLSVSNWEQLIGECGWSQKQYIETIQFVARRAVVAE